MRFVVVVVASEGRPGWREVVERVVVDVVGTAGVEVANPSHGGLEERPTVSAVDSSKESIRMAEDQGNREGLPIYLMYFLNCLATLSRNPSESHSVQLSREALPSGT